MTLPRFALLALLTISLQSCDKASDSPPTTSSTDKTPSGNSFDSTLLPKVITRNVWKVNRIQATCEGLVFLEGGSRVTESGVCWGTQTAPTISGAHAKSNGMSTNWDLVMSELQPGTTYHARAYATNSYGTSYGEEIDFTTDSALPAPTCTPDINTTVINLEHQNYTFVSAETNGLSYGNYGIVGHASSADMAALFTKAPKSGLYETIYPQDLDRWDTTHVVIRGVVDNATVIAKPGSVVSVVKKGENQYSISFCQVPFNFDFSGISATFVTNGNLTTNH